MLIFKGKGSKRARLRKNFFLSFLIILTSWTALAFIIFFVDPASFAAIPLFFLALAVALIFTLSFLFIDTKKGVFASLGVLVFLLFRYLQIDNILNLLLSTGILVSAAIFLSKKRP